MTLQARLTELAQVIGLDIKTLNTLIGPIGGLNTNDRSNLVAAINNVLSLVGAIDITDVIDDLAMSSITNKTYSAQKITNLVEAAKAALVDSSPTTLNTLNELASALANDPNFATTIATALGNRVRIDAAQVFTAVQQLQARININAAGASDLEALNNALGTIDTDWVAAYTAAKS